MAVGRVRWWSGGAAGGQEGGRRVGGRVGSVGGDRPKLDVGTAWRGSRARRVLDIGVSDSGDCPNDGISDSSVLFSVKGSHRTPPHTIASAHATPTPPHPCPGLPQSSFGWQPSSFGRRAVSFGRLTTNCSTTMLHTFARPHTHNGRKSSFGRQLPKV